jgi:hypothetical protein
MRSSEIYYDDKGNRILYAEDAFTQTNLELERLNAERLAKANKQAQMQETRKILTFYNQLQKQQQNPQPSLLEQPPQQQPQQPLQSNNNTNASNNVLKHLQLMRRIAGIGDL